MNIKFQKAAKEDASKLIEIASKCFYSDYMKYGYCPGYNMPKEVMEKSIDERTVFKVMDDEKVIGYTSARKIDKGSYFIHCVCIIPEYENNGIGQKAVKFLESQFPNAKHFSLETPADKLRNHHFYKKLAYTITKEYMDGPVKLVLFEKDISAYSK